MLIAPSIWQDSGKNHNHTENQGNGAIIRVFIPEGYVVFDFYRPIKPESPNPILRGITICLVITPGILFLLRIWQYAEAGISKLQLVKPLQF
jgi:hypothetical protein